MSDTVESLILDLLEWIGPNARPYTEVLEAWRTSCPRLSVWEDVHDRGFVASHHETRRGRLYFSLSSGPGAPTRTPITVATRSDVIASCRRPRSAALASSAV